MKEADLTYEQAIGFLPDGENIHTFRQGGMSIIGCDWERDKILDALKNHPVLISGDMAQSMKHGLVIKDNRGYLFIETKTEVTL